MVTNTYTNTNTGVNADTAARGAVQDESLQVADLIAVVLGHAEGLLRALEGFDSHAFSARQRAACVNTLNRVFNASHAAVLSIVAVLEEQNDAAVLGVRSTTALLTGRVGMAPEQSTRTVLTARTLAAHPSLFATAMQGTLSPAHTREIARGLNAARGSADAFAAAKLAKDLLDTARTETLAHLRSKVTDLKRTESPGSPDGPDDPASRCFVRTRTTRTGLVRVEALLDEHQGATFRDALQAAAGPVGCGDTPTGGVPADTATAGAGDAAQQAAEQRVASSALATLAGHYLKCATVRSARVAAARERAAAPMARDVARDMTSDQARPSGTAHSPSATVPDKPAGGSS